MKTYVEVKCDGGVWSAKYGDGRCEGKNCKVCQGTGKLLKEKHNGVRTEGHIRGCLCSECA